MEVHYRKGQDPVLRVYQNGVETEQIRLLEIETIQEMHLTLRRLGFQLKDAQGRRDAAAKAKALIENEQTEKRMRQAYVERRQYMIDGFRWAVAGVDLSEFYAGRQPKSMLSAEPDMLEENYDRLNAQELKSLLSGEQKSSIIPAEERAGRCNQTDENGSDDRQLLGFPHLATS